MCRVVRSLQDRIAFIPPPKSKMYTSDWNSFSINIGWWAEDYNIQSTNLCIQTAQIVRAERNSTAFVNFLICDVNVNIKLWRNLIKIHLLCKSIVKTLHYF